jgi:hypothetical protein
VVTCTRDDQTSYTSGIVDMRRRLDRERVLVDLIAHDQDRRRHLRVARGIRRDARDAVIAVVHDHERDEVPLGHGAVGGDAQREAVDLVDAIGLGARDRALQEVTRGAHRCIARRDALPLHHGDDVFRGEHHLKRFGVDRPLGRRQRQVSTRIRARGERRERYQGQAKRSHQRAIVPVMCHAFLFAAVPDGATWIMGARGFRSAGRVGAAAPRVIDIANTVGVGRQRCRIRRPVTSTS